MIRGGEGRSVLVLEGSLTPSLAVVRSLGRWGARVTVADHLRWGPGQLSRYASRRVRMPNPQRSRGAFLEFLERHLAAEGYDLVLPVSDYTTQPVAEEAARFVAHARLAVAPADQILVANDKVRTTQAALAAGVPCPRTWFPKSEVEAAALAGELPYPVVVKPRSKVHWEGDRPVLVKVTSRNFVTEAAALLPTYRAVAALSPRPYVQEAIRGEAVGFFALTRGGEPLATFGHRRVREYPVSGGTSSCRESHFEPQADAEGRRLLAAMRWDGVAMVEFKRDAKDGVFKLMEINGRWWGSLALALAAGVDFPRLYAELLLTGNVPDPPAGFPEGVRCRALLPWDLLWLAESLRGPGRLRAIREFLAPRGGSFDVVSLADPLPTLGALSVLAGYAREVAGGGMNLRGERT